MYQNKEIVIDFDPAGGVSALHMDEFPLSFLGKMTIGRASTIDFNQTTQRFDIMLKDATKYTVDGWRVYKAGTADYQCAYPDMACGFAGYDEARGFEVAWIQACRKREVDPLDSEGIAIIEALREAGNSPQLL